MRQEQLQQRICPSERGGKQKVTILRRMMPPNANYKKNVRIRILYKSCQLNPPQCNCLLVYYNDDGGGGGGGDDEEEE